MAQLSGKKKDPGFRASALEKMSNPERLDELMVVTKPKAWVALMTFGILIYLIALWSYFGRIPDRVSGKGILIPGGSLLQVEADTTGMITSIFVKVGDVVEEGQKIAGVSKEELELEINTKAIRISGVRSCMPRMENARFRLAEIQHGPFERVLFLPAPIDTERVSASYSNGFLEVKLAKLKFDKITSCPLQIKDNKK